MADNVSPLAPEHFPDLPTIEGVRLTSAHCGIRYQGRTDLMVALLDAGTTVAGVFTRSLMPGAPVDWCRRALSRGKIRAIVVNSGNANVFTGRQGKAAVEATELLDRLRFVPFTVEIPEHEQDGKLPEPPAPTHGLGLFTEPVDQGPVSTLLGSKGRLSGGGGSICFSL